MGWIDNAVALWMSSLAGHQPTMDYVFIILGGSNSFKILPLIAGLFAIWQFGEHGRRQAIVGGIGAFVALAVARIVQDLGPHRLRPLSSPLYHFPQHAAGRIVDWSSFPSDTLSLALALSTAIYFASRRLGILAFAWTAFVAFCKLYAGYHYPSDVLTGAAIGFAATFTVHRNVRLTNWLLGQLHKYRAKNPALLAWIAFLIAFELASFMDDVRYLGHSGYDFVVHHHLVV